MGPQDAYDRMDVALLLDVREKNEWDAGHIDGAMHIPMNEIPERIDDIALDTPVIAVCRSGARSGKVTEWLRQKGYDVENLEGGMQAWAAEGLPFVAEGGGEPVVI